MADAKQNSTANQVASVVSLPGYKIKDVLGKGGMATVYLAIQESIGREVALKILAPDHTDETFSERFLREARIISQLSHPNIITVYDAGIHQGCHYMTMEYVPGKTLRDARDVLTRKQKLEIIKQVALALDFAGKKGYVHRDIKPENILLHEDGRAILTDFGIARGHDTTQGLTVTGKVIGTPYYMSPEQTKGLKVDHRSDIYSLGVVLFQALAGYVPYDGPSLVAIGIKHLSDPIPSLPKGMETFQKIINTCLSKDPEHRFQSAAQLVDALNSITDAELDFIEAKGAALDRAGKNHSSATIIDSAAIPATSTPAVKKQPVQQKKIIAQRPSSQSSTSPMDITATDDYQRLKSRRRIFYLFLLLLTLVFAFLLRDRLIPLWNQHAAPVIDSYLPSDKQSVSGEQIPSTNIAPDEITTVNDSDPAAISDSESGKNSASESLMEKSAVTRTDIDHTSLEQLAQLQQSLQAHPENAMTLAALYKKRLREDPADPTSRRGLKELREWYGININSAIAERDIAQGRMLLDMLKDSFPRTKDSERYALLEQRLAKAEKIHVHLQRASDYTQENALIVPPGANALEEYNAILDFAPGTIEATEGIQQIADVYYEQATMAREEGKLQQALESTDSGLLAKSDDNKLVELRKELQTAIEQETLVDSYLDKAKQRQQSRNLVEPKGDSALYYYRKALEVDKLNSRALTGVSEIEQNYIRKAKTAIIRQDFDKAESILNDARRYFANSKQVATTQKELQQAIINSKPTITHILLSDKKIVSLSQTQSDVLDPVQILYGAIKYKNFDGPATILNAYLVQEIDGVAILQKPLILNGKRGEHFFELELPIKGISNGSYKLDLYLNKKPFYSTNFLVRRR